MNRKAREQKQQRRGVWLVVAGEPIQIHAEDIPRGVIAFLAQRLREVARDELNLDEEGLVPLGQVLDEIMRATEMDKSKLKLVAGGGHANAQVTLDQLHAEMQRETALAALRRAAQLVGRLRKCKHCPEDVCIFRNGAKHIIVNAATGLDHEGECIGAKR